MLGNIISKPGLVGATVILTLSLSGVRAQGQSEAELNLGDVVRVNHDFVGTLMSINNGAQLTLLGEGKPRCMPGIGHGDAPRCDPAPTVRRIVDWHGSTVERQLLEVSHTRRTAVGFLLGAAAFAPLGYVTGPSLGYGKVDGCVEASVTSLCSTPVPQDEFDARQRSQDQSRGAIAFAILGGSIGAIVARKTVNEWVQVQPPSLVGGDASWTVGVRLPLANR